MMKFVVLASILGTASLAHAEPTSYAQGGVTAGADHVGWFTAYTVEGGYRVHDGLWLHGMFAYGGMAGIDEPTYDSQYLVARAGVEGRACVGGGVLCAMAGVDAAARHEMLMNEYDSGKLDGTGLVPRVAFDLGGKHLRYRGGVDVTVDGHGFGGIAVATGLAYQW